MHMYYDKCFVFGGGGEGGGNFGSFWKVFVIELERFVGGGGGW